MYYLDLHLHTIESDGKLTMEELILQAKENLLTHIAITNHDTLDNLDFALKFGKEKNIKVIPGIELTTYYNHEPIHIIGLFKNDDFQQKELSEFLIEQKKYRIERAKKIIANLNHYYQIQIDENRVLSQTNTITRSHLANEIMRNYPYTKEEIFKYFLGNENKAYISATQLSTLEGLNLLKRNNALTILAHPTHIHQTDFKEIMDLGFDGIEAFYPKNQENEEKIFSDYALKKNLVLSVGSDFHCYNDVMHGEIGMLKMDTKYAKIILEKIYSGEKL